MKNIIEITDLSKKYYVSNESQGMYSTLRETLQRSAKKWVRKWQSPYSSPLNPKPISDEFWALKEVNLSIQEGDRVGIIGRNGAGKSTLLKILSKITVPTTGQLRMRGRVASLLEVGTGFHPELTGRENIFLNGAILGMKQQEIKAKFDDIVAFAEIEKFLETPVKKYSSGMITRLGFGIAAHLDPDILVIDEVLAVGDALFQEKCLKKLNELGSCGRTVLFVSHDINSILNLCNKGIYLDQGRVANYGPIDTCVSEYMRQCHEATMHWQGDLGDNHIRFYSMRLLPEDPRKEFFYQNEKVSVEIEYEIILPSHDILMGIGLWSSRNQLLAQSSPFDNQAHFDKFVRKGHHKASFMIDTGLFHEGEYHLRLDCIHHHLQRKIIHDEIKLKFPIFSQNANVREGYTNARAGVFLGNHWELKSE